MNRWTKRRIVSKVPRLKTVALAGQAVSAGDANAIVAGGMEHMSGAPYLLKTARWGQRMGHGEMTDSMISDALWDCFYDCHMGQTAENVADEQNLHKCCLLSRHAPSANYAPSQISPTSPAEGRRAGQV